MRTFLPAIALICFLVSRSLTAEELPRFRPALLGTGPKSLVNLIDCDGLVKKGQGNATVTFEAYINRQGRGLGTQIDARSAGSYQLEKELFFQLENHASFVPAVYEHKKEDVILYGTVVFAVIQGKPHLRIYLNQEDNELRRQSDFIAPQNVMSVHAPFAEIYGDSRAQTLNARVDAVLDVDSNGKVTSTKVTRESHPDLELGKKVVVAMQAAPFIPAFRNGKPVDSKFNMPVRYSEYVPHHTSRQTLPTAW